MTQEAPPVVSNYPRENQVIPVTLSYVDVTERLCAELRSWIAISFFATLVAIVLERVYFPELWQQALILAVLGGFWWGLFDPLRKSLGEYSRQAGWKRGKRRMAGSMLFSAFLIIPGILCILTVRGWVASDLAARGVRRPWSRNAWQSLNQIGGIDGS